MKDNKDIEQVWRYLHGELEAPAVEELEARMNADASFNDFVEETRQADATLRELSPVAEVSEVEFQRKMLDAWEAEQMHSSLEEDVIQSVPAAGLKATKARRRRSLVHGPFGVALSFAASLLVIFLVGVQQHVVAPSPIAWESTEIIQSVAYRGPDGADVPSMYSREELTRLSTALRNSVKDTYEQITPKKKRSILNRKAEWLLSAKLQELRAGRLGVHVKAFASDGKGGTKEWSKFFSDADVFMNQVTDYGSKIAVDLVGLKPNTSGS